MRKRRGKENDAPAFAADLVKAAIDNDLTDGRIKSAQELAATLTRLDQRREFKSQVKSFDSQLAELSRNFSAPARLHGLAVEVAPFEAVTAARAGALRLTARYRDG